MPTCVLFIDDEPENIRPHVDALRNAGYDVTHTETSAGARRFLGERSFDLIVLDLILRSGEDEVTYGAHEPSPEIGLALHKAIREDLGLRDVPIVFLTVVQEAAPIRQIKDFERQFDDQCRVLVKPKLPSRLLKEVRELTAR